MLAVDRAFASMAAKEGVPAAFAAYAADDVRMFPDGGASYAGRDNLIARFANWPEGASLSWTPVDGAAAPGGDFGYTWGRFVFTAQSDAGETSEYGKYVSIWRKERDGAWKFIVDIGNSNPAPDASD
jgi:ketosteroid isomerase-like protein